MKSWYRNFLLPAGLLAGTVIGAGMFALPYLFTTAGIAVGGVALALGGIAYLVIHLCYADLIVRSPGEHRFAGYAKLYLGRVGFWVAAGVALFEMVSVLTIYLILSISFSHILFPGSEETKLVLFWVLGSLALFFSVKRLALAEFLVTAGMVAIVAGIVALGIPHFSRFLSEEAFSGWGTMLLPLGPVLFALSGRVAIPSTVAYFRERGVVHSRHALRSAITVGTLLPVALYALFVIAIVSLSPSISEDSVTGLIGNVPGWAMIAIGVLGFISLWSSYITVGIDTKNLLQYDFKIPPGFAAAVVLFAPPLLYFSGFQNFIGLVSFVGGIFLAFEGLLVVAMWWSAKRFAPHHPPLLERIPAAVTLGVTILFAIVALHEIFKYAGANWF